MSTPLTNDQIRLAILELLLQESEKRPMNLGISNRKIAETLAISQNCADFNLEYLKAKGLVKFLAETFNGNWARITASGCDVVAHKNLYSDQVPFVNVTIQNQNIQGNTYGAVQAAGNSQVTVNQQDAFGRAYGEIEKSNLTPEQKGSIQKDVNELEQELKRGNQADANRVKNLWLKIKKNANWLIPTLAQVVTEGLKIACGLP